MRLWQLAVALVAIIAAGVCMAGFLSDHSPSDYNDHLLDGVPGLGGPKG